MRKLLLTASVIALGAVVTPASAETVRWARASDALTLDPHSQNQGVTHNFNHHIYETLLNRDVEGNLIPRLATEWYIKADDPTVWVFKLREGVKFHGGQDFTAEDVVFSLNRARSDKSNMRQLHADVADVIAVDDLTVEVKMSGPSPLYPNNITNTFIMDKGWSEEHDVVEVQDFGAGEDNYAVRNANGTGPYVLQSRQPDDRSVLAWFDGHWDEKPAVTEIIYLRANQQCIALRRPFQAHTAMVEWTRSTHQATAMLGVGAVGHQTARTAIWQEHVHAVIGGVAALGDAVAINDVGQQLAVQRPGDGAHELVVFLAHPGLELMERR